MFLLNSIMFSYIYAITTVKNCKKFIADECEINFLQFFKGKIFFTILQGKKFGDENNSRPVAYSK